MAGSQHEVYTIFCLIVGDNSPFPVKIAKDETVGYLKKLIKEEKHKTFANTEADQLKLYHVELADNDQLVENVKNATLGIPLRATQRLASISDGTFKDDIVHIIVESPESDTPSSGSKRKPSVESSESAQDNDSDERPTKRPRRSSPLANVSTSTAQRKSTVCALYARLKAYHFILVRGTPASGKSTLAQLLGDHIEREEKDVVPIQIVGWAKDGTGWLTKLEANGYNRYTTKNQYIIIDEAQLTYWDTALWNSFLKALDDDLNVYVILFASYGSAMGYISVEGTPLVADEQRISLRPVDHDDGIPQAGLLLSKAEFTDMVNKILRLPHRFEDEFLEYVFEITAGHTGAVKDLMRMVSNDNSYRRLNIDNNETFSLKAFSRNFPPQVIWKTLGKMKIFSRGLPSLPQLQEPAFACIFRAVLRDKSVEQETFASKTDREVLHDCWKRGWLHAATQKQKTVYIFTTPLHQLFAEYHLGSSVSDPSSIPDQNILDFAIKVIRHFSRIQLTMERKIGTSGIQRPPEAQYQDEFYRCCHSNSGGSLYSLPEFGTAKGRVDFYIPSKKWGVELLRDGDRLEAHSARFTGQGQYTELEFKDYIILDFRKTLPKIPHPGILNLYHVVFDDDYVKARVLEGSALTPVCEEFMLLNH